nr:disulfide bond formation protein B [uncultured Ralstonia sp.]
MPANSRAFFLLIAVISFGVVGYALYLQHVDGLQPCPLCILQRFAFLGIGVFSLLAALSSATRLLWHGLGMLSGLAGLCVAAYHVSLLLNPKATCGIDPIENWVNALPTAKWLPQVFEADGLCVGPMPPVLGLSVPVWSLIWLVILSLTLVVGMIRREKR